MHIIYLYICPPRGYLRHLRPLSHLCKLSSLEEHHQQQGKAALLEASNVRYHPRPLSELGSRQQAARSEATMGSLGSEKGVVSPSSRATSERSTGRAAILGIGTAVPGHEVIQSGFADYYFNLSNCNHMDSLKDKLARICEKSMIERRYIALNDDMVKANPNMAAFRATSLDARQELMEAELPFLAAEAARKAIADWGRPASGITHIVFSNNGGSAVPGPDYELVKLLGLPFSTNRFMLYQQGCVGGATAIRLAKDISENNRGARVLVVCCEVTSIAGYRGPSESHVETLVGQALFGDGSGALIIGALEDSPHGSEVDAVERPIFEIVRASQSIIPDSQGAITVRITEAGLLAALQSNVAQCIAAGVEKLAAEALAPIGAEGDPNAVFWVVHPGGPAILDQVEAKLELGKEKLQASREVLRDYGNMSSPSVFFVMEAMRKRSQERGLGTAGEGLEWGVLLGFGPGITAETAVLRCPRV